MRRFGCGWHRDRSNLPRGSPHSSSQSALRMKFYFFVLFLACYTQVPPYHDFVADTQMPRPRLITDNKARTMIMIRFTLTMMMVIMMTMMMMMVHHDAIPQRTVFLLQPLHLCFEIAGEIPFCSQLACVQPSIEPGAIRICILLGQCSI